MAREHTKIVTVGENKYRITDFDALNGGMVTLFVLNKVIPMLKVMNLDLADLMERKSDNWTDELIGILEPALRSLEGEDLAVFMERCLKQVEIMLPAGAEPVMRGGEFTVDVVKYSTKTAFILCWHAIQGLIVDFFGENALNFLKIEDIKGTKR